MGGEGTVKKKDNWYTKNRQGEVKNSIGNIESKELTCMTHEHELRGGGEMLEGEGVQGRGGIQEEKQWDNCNSIVNKIYLKLKVNK